MPRINYVPKARKDQGQCGKCGKPLPKGCEYRWIKFRRGSKRKRCTDSKCNWRGSELTQSEKIGNARAAGEALEDTLNAQGFGPEDLESARDEFVSAVEEVIDLCQESLDAMPEGLQDSSDSGQTLQQYIDDLETWKGEAEDLDFEDFDYDEDSDDDEDNQRDAWFEEKRSELDGVACNCPL
jgi:hypothetical protein